MFKIEYRISEKEFDSLLGDKGYYKMFFNENSYGELYPEEIEEVMGTEYLYDWFEDMVQIATELHKKECIFLSNIESYNQWVEFKRNGDDLYINIVTADKSDGSRPIEYELNNKNYEKKNAVPIPFLDFKKEIAEKGVSYIQGLSNINHTNSEEIKIRSLNDAINKLLI